jgi:hypothetical protein
VKHPWNADLAEQFHDHFISTNIIDSKDEIDVWNLFEQCFVNLRCKVAERKLRDDKDEIQVTQWVMNKKKERLSVQRPHTRHGTVGQQLFL